MEQSPINLKQKRDFGDVFNAAFTFIGQEFKPLAKAMLFFVLPFLLISAILSVFINIEQQKAVHMLRPDNPAFTANPLSSLATVYKYIGLTMLVYLFAITAMRCTLYGYIKAYNEKGKDNFTIDDVWSEVRKFFFPVLGTSLLISMMVCVGFVFCIVPGVWLGVSLSLIYISMMSEGKGMGSAFSRSFDLTRQDWWVTLAIILVSYIIVYILSLLLSIPAMILGIKSVFTNFKNIQQTQEINFPISVYIVSAITSLATYILFIIPFTTIAIQYFSLVETKDKVSLQNKIEQIN
jgi:hypothetical protein